MPPLVAELKSWIAVHLSVALILLTARLLWKPPGELLVVLGLIYVFCSAVFWVFNRRIRRSGMNGAYLPLTWVLLSVVVLGSVYRYDRAGWNWYRLTGYNVTLAEIIPDSDLPPADFIKKHPMFSIDPQDSSILILPRGQYAVNETIVVPRGTALVIDPGTVLRFAPGCSLISYRPIIAEGREDDPVSFEAQDNWRKWGVVGIVRAGRSVFRFARFRNGRQARVNNIDFFASLSVIQSDVHISECQFLDAYGKDAVNVQYGNVLVQNNIFRNAYKDGIDLDGGSGIVCQNRFFNCADEGIDLSENERIEAFGNEIYDARGGRVAADIHPERIKELNTLGYSQEEESVYTP